MVLEIDAPVGNNPFYVTRVELRIMMGVSNLLAFQANICLEAEKSVYNISAVQLALWQRYYLMIVLVEKDYIKNISE